MSKDLGLYLERHLKTLINLGFLIHLHSLLKYYLNGYNTPKLKTEEEDVNRRYRYRQDRRWNKNKLGINHIALWSLYIRAIAIFHSQTLEITSVFPLKIIVISILLNILKFQT